LHAGHASEMRKMPANASVDGSQADEEAEARGDDSRGARPVGQRIPKRSWAITAHD
jgi:hypothetical protein